MGLGLGLGLGLGSRLGLGLGLAIPNLRVVREAEGVVVLVEDHKAVDRIRVLEEVLAREDGLEPVRPEDGLRREVAHLQHECSAGYAGSE